VILNVSNISKLFAAEIVLENVSFRLDRHEKVALVGRNGAGKTTFLKILTGEYQPDGGSIQWERGASVGYLSQSSMASSEKTVLQVATEAREHLVEMEARMRELEIAMENGATTEDLDEYSLLQEHFISEGGYSVETDLKVVLKRLGFTEEAFDKPVSALSGGEKTRLALAKLLLEEPDLLILDEPTNHLDLDAIEWLESWIKGYHGTVMCVSHDRTFLQAICERVIEIRDGVANSYPGTFEKYLVLRREEDERLEMMAEKQEQEMAKLDEFVRRFMNSQRTAQARGRLKMLERMEAQKITTRKDGRSMHASLKVQKRAGDIVLKCDKLSMAFGAQKLFQDLSWTVNWGDRWGVIGANGAGKSTLMKVALGELEAVSGQGRLGSNVDLGWFRQDATFLDLDLTPLETMNIELGMEHGPARNYLGRFLVTGDDVFRPIRTMSGGERTKIALAVILAMNPNVLILDEPTNHLDIESREALAILLKEFDGTLIMISHDRWMLEQITEKTMDLQPGVVHQFPGAYSEYREWKRNGMGMAEDAKPKAKVANIFVEPIKPTLTPREMSKEIGRLEKLLVATEAKIEKLETDLATLEGRMSDPQPTDDIREMSYKYVEIKDDIDRAMGVWAETGELLEELKTARG
jgi:ATP-binding cassette subfamily F protein 3